MSKIFQCCECSAWVNIPLARAVKTVSCDRCGETYFCNDDAPPRKFYPALSMYPVTVKGVPSKWMLPHTRPIFTGYYELRFRHTEPNIIVAHWNGTMFVVPITGERISMQHFLTWRGVLA